jgi:hypothetical protein
MNWKAAFVLVACAAGLMAQTPPVTILEVDIENGVLYIGDVDTASRRAVSPTMVPASTNPEYRTFKESVFMGDIVAVNGKPVKGLYQGRFSGFLASTTLAPGRAIADLPGACPASINYVFLHADGTVIGTIMVQSVQSGVPLPGAPAAAPSGNLNAIVGGTGAFLGARGQTGTLRLVSGNRFASMAEDPAYRRIHGGGKYTHFIHLIPMTWPEVLAVPTGPAIFHGDDFSPVTAEKPARAGELLMMSVSGLGPVKPNLDPGKPFPAWQAGKEHAVNSPVDVTVNGKAAQVVWAIGWPGMNNVYRVDFRVPEGTVAGPATLGLSVAWINGPEAKFPVR